MILPGLVSVTFRQLTPRRIIELVHQAGLSGIEWGGDVHVPHGDIATARDVRQMTLDAGLEVVSYGSYYRTWPVEPVPFDQVLETAVALGAPLIRVWAGKLSSADSTPDHREAVVSESRRIAQLAGEAGIGIAFEFHAGTLTDTNPSTINTLKQIDHPNIGVYWQPRLHESQAENSASLDLVSPWLRHLHVFHWQRKTTTDQTTERMPLSAGRSAWSQYLEQVSRLGARRYAMLEFVKDNSPQALREDAVELQNLLSRNST